ncbi:hypothetical protein ATCC90586_001929 [Pythium insidiosum]|nr:hypothetical protein ATCC90586_001929 [Pythium insidiosum]
MSSVSSEMRFPMEERFLPRVRISKNRFEDWRAVAIKEIVGVLQNPKSWYYNPNSLKDSFRPMYEKDAIRGSARSYEDTNKKDTLCLAHLPVTLDDVAFGLHAVTTLDQRAILAHMYEGNFLDGAVLRVHEGGTTEDPFHFCGLKWIAYTSGAPGIVPPRDSIFFEYSATMTDAFQRRVLVQFTRSFPLQPEEIKERKNGFIRTVQSELAFYRTEGSGVLVQSLGCFDPGAETPAWVATRSLTDLFNSVHHLVCVADARAVVVSGLVRRFKSPKMSSESKMCIVCRKKFNMLRSRHTCRSCGHGMCKNCMTNLTFFNEASTHAPNIPVTLTEKFCTTCIKESRERRSIDSLTASMTKMSVTPSASLASMSNYSEREDSIASIPSQTKSFGVSMSSSTTTATLSVSSPSELDRHTAGRSLQHSQSQSDRELGEFSEYRERAIVPENEPVGKTSTSSNPDVFNKMNESIRRQEELLMTLQMGIQARVHQPAYPAAYGAPGIAAAPAVPAYPAPPLPVSSDFLGTPPSPAHGVNAEERFEVLS